MKYVTMFIRRRRRVAKFIMSGGITAIVNIAALLVLTELCKVWYLTSSVIAFFISFFTNFFLQKWWTFEDRARTGTGMKMGLFFVNALLNLALNTVLMVAFVEWVHLWYVLAQVLVMGILMFMNYTIYRLFIFRAVTSDNT
jgi:putative flippase GtrA